MMYKQKGLKIIILVSVLFTLLSSVAYAEKQILNRLPYLVFYKKLALKDSFFISQPIFSSGSRYLAAYFNGTKTINIYEAKTFNLLASLPPEILFKNKLPEIIRFLGPEGNNLLILSAGKPAKVINWQTKKLVKTFPVPGIGHKINCFDMTSDGKYFVIGTRKGLQLWNLLTGIKIRTFLPDKTISAVDISPNNQYLIYAEEGYALNGVRIVDLNTLIYLDKPLLKLSKECKKCIEDHAISNIKFIETNKIIATFNNLIAYEKGLPEIFLVDMEKKILIGGVKPACRRVKDIKFAKENEVLIVTSAHYDELMGFCSGIDFIDIATMKPISRKSLHTPFLSATVSYNLKWLVSVTKTPTEAFLTVYSLFMK